MHTLTSDQARVISRTRRRYGRASARTQLLDMQAKLLADVLNPATKPLERAACARAYEVLEERIRIINGKPLPGHLKPETPRTLRKRTKAIIAIASADLPPSHAQG